MVFAHSQEVENKCLEDDQLGGAHKPCSGEGFSCRMAIPRQKGISRFSELRHAFVVANGMHRSTVYDEQQRFEATWQILEVGYRLMERLLKRRWMDQHGERVDIIEVNLPKNGNTLRPRMQSV